jgi:NADH-quinone oxidoreductase subunit M
MIATATSPLLTLLLALPAVAAMVVWVVPARWIRWFALGAALLTLLLTLVVVAWFDPGFAGFQLVDRHTWLPTLNIDYLLGIDGLSLPFVPATALLFVVVTVASWRTVSQLPRLFFSLLLLLQCFTLGIFTAIDMLLFLFFWELTLVPIYFLTSLWGVGPLRRYAAVKYTLFMLAGGMPLLFAIVLLAFNHAEVNGLSAPAGFAFDLPTLLETPFADPDRARLVFLLLLLGFAIKTPLFPFHTWLPVIVQEGPVALATVLLGLKLGAYGLIRFAIPLSPGAAIEYGWIMTTLGVVGILYGALLALNQTNLRRMLAFSSISHVGLVVVGISTLSLSGLQGAIFQLINFSLITAGALLVTGFLHQRLGTSEILSLGGVVSTMPLLSGLFLFFGLAAIGVPPTSGFVAELLIIISTLTVHPGAGLAALFGVVLGAGYLLTAYRRAFLGPASSPAVLAATDLDRRESMLLLLLATIVLLLGLIPSLVLDPLAVSGQQWIDRLVAAASGPGQLH